VEKEAKEKLQKQQDKAQRKKERQLAATGVVKTKRKGLRIRKGVRVKVRQRLLCIHRMQAVCSCLRLLSRSTQHTAGRIE
jgi:hypothetical protein